MVMPQDHWSEWDPRGYDIPVTGALIVDIFVSLQFSSGFTRRRGQG